MGFRENLARVRDQIVRAAEVAGRDPATVKLVAVTKTMAPERLLEAWAAGVRDFGENRVQEARAKAPLVQAPVHWHLIGPLQTNKVGQAAGFFASFHALDRLVVAEKLARALRRTGSRLPVLLQVNVTGEDTKAGVAPGEVADLLHRLEEWPELEVQGLTTVPPRVADPEASRPVFCQLRELRDRLADQGRLLPELSMGMSDDYVVAIQEGATYIRLGRALFGPRD